MTEEACQARSGSSTPSLDNASFAELVSHPDPRALSTPHLVPNPLGARAEEANRDWAERFLGRTGSPAISRLLRTRSALLASYTYPRAGFEPLSLASDLIAWLFFFDDYHGEGWTTPSLEDLVDLFDSLEEVLARGTPPTEALSLHVALANLRDRMMDLAGPKWLDRFTVGMRKYFNGCLLEYPHRRGRRSLSLRNYRIVRRWSVGLDPVMDMVELGQGAALSAEQAGRPDLQELRDGCALLCAWVNDIYSFNKEKGDHDPINLVSVLRHERGCSFQDALDMAIALFKADYREFRENKQRFAKGGSARDIEIAVGLEDWVLGNLTWSATTLRYKP